uniref:Myb-like domain-containing protein n=1 Tax=Noccaea caerulescens TaxID=107243 RepID=A0A1J3GUH4_NOCCA
MEEGSSGSRRTRSQVAPDWTVKDCMILVNEIAAVEADCSNALSSFQKWTMISENCNALDVHRTLNQCRRKWDSLVSDYNQIKQWEQGRGLSYRSLSTEKRKKLNLPGNIDNELLEAINAVVMIQEDKAGTEPDDSDSDPEAEEDSEILHVITELGFAGSKRSRQQTMVVMKENPPHKRKIEEEPPSKRVVENIQEQGAKATNQNKTMAEKKPVEKMMTVEEVEAMKAKLGEKADLIHAIVGRRNVTKDGETGDGISVDDRLKFVRQQGDELIASLSEIVNTLNRLR